MRFDTLDGWLSWQEGLHPTAIELGLERVAEVWQRLHPDAITVPVVSVAGTNGKGSSVAMLESILLAAGYSTGCYTSPHLLRYNERIRIGGNPIDDASLCDAFAVIDAARGDLSLTFFEFGTLAALWLFVREKVEVMLLEVGLGGRLDAVNIIDADVALLTTVDLDHADWLGSDREQIGYEKSGIFRPGRYAVCSDAKPPTSVLDHAHRIGCDLLLREREFTASRTGSSWCWQCSRGGKLDGLPIPALAAGVQVDNAAAVLCVLKLLEVRLPMEREAIVTGLQRVSLPGRMQRLPGEVEQILDVAHNPQAARELAHNLTVSDAQGRTFAVFGLLGDKSLEGVLEPLVNVIDGWFLVDLPGARGREAGQIASALRELDGDPLGCYPDVASARAAAMDTARPGDRLVVFGSFGIVSAALAAPYNFDSSHTLPAGGTMP